MAVYVVCDCIWLCITIYAYFPHFSVCPAGCKVADYSHLSQNQTVHAPLAPTTSAANLTALDKIA